MVTGRFCSVIVSSVWVPYVHPKNIPIKSPPGAAACAAGGSAAAACVCCSCCGGPSSPPSKSPIRSGSASACMGTYGHRQSEADIGFWHTAPTQSSLHTTLHHRYMCHAYAPAVAVLLELNGWLGRRPATSQRQWRPAQRGRGPAPSPGATLPPPAVRWGPTAEKQAQFDTGLARQLQRVLSSILMWAPSEHDSKTPIGSSI
jgi:hypothetical protein